MNCLQCGAVIDDVQMKFCAQCGAALPSAPPQDASAEVPVPPVAATKPPPPPPPSIIRPAASLYPQVGGTPSPPPPPYSGPMAPPQPHPPAYRPPAFPPAAYSAPTYPAPSYPAPQPNYPPQIVVVTPFQALPAARPPATPPTTTLLRSGGVAVGMAALLLIVAFALWQTLLVTAGANDPWQPWVGQLYGSHVVSPAQLLTPSIFGYALDDSTYAQQLSELYVRDLLTILIGLLPLGIAGTYWLALRRLRQGHRQGQWGAAFGWCVAFFTLMMVGLGAEETVHLQVVAQQDVFYHTPLWGLFFLLAVPALIPILLGLACLCGGIGMLFARLYALWQPVAGISGPLAHTPIWLVTGLLALVQTIIYQWLHATILQTAPTQAEWFPLAGLLIIGLASWAAFPTQPLASAVRNTP